MTLTEPTNIWCIDDNLDIRDQRELGNVIGHLMKGQGPFEVMKTYYYGDDPAMKGFPWDGYFRIKFDVVKGATPAEDIFKTGWVHGIQGGLKGWKVSFTAPAPVPTPPPTPGSDTNKYWTALTKEELLLILNKRG